jgi:hypothetical protein
MENLEDIRFMAEIRKNCRKIAVLEGKRRSDTEINYSVSFRGKKIYFPLVKREI